MPGLVLDTHAAVWYLQRDSRLSQPARDAMHRAIQGGDPAYVASISVVELTYLVEKGRVSAAALEILRKSLADPSSGLSVVPLDLAIADALAKVPREDVPDLPDRVIAATALSLNLPLVTGPEDQRGRDSHDLVKLWFGPGAIEPAAPSPGPRP